MAMIKGVDKVVGAEGFDFALLRSMVKALNEAEVLAKPIKAVAVSKPVLVDNFIKGIESVPEGSEEEKKIPAEVVNLYHSYVDVIEDKAVGLETVVGKKESPEKAVKEGKKKVKDKKIKQEGGPGKDVYGFRIDSKMHLVALVVEEGGAEGVEVKDIKDADWNVRKNSYKSYWMKIVDGGFAEFKDGRICLKGKG